MSLKTRITKIRGFFRYGRLDSASEACKKIFFVLFGTDGMIKEVLEASGMDMLVKIYETQEDLP